MFKFAYLLFIISIWVATASGTTVCNCQNPICVDKPTNIRQCLVASKNYYLNIIRQNYDLIKKQISSNLEKCTSGVWSKFKTLVKQMNNATNNIVYAFYNSKDCNATSAVKDAFDVYRRIKIGYNSFGRRGFRKFSTKCNKIIQHIRLLPYAAADNLKNAMLACSNLKTQNCVLYTSRSGFVKPRSNSIDCNCLYMSYISAPESKEQCFSKSFTGHLYKWYQDNMRTVEDTLKLNNGCDYSHIIHFFSEIKQRMTDIIKMFQSKDITFEQMKDYADKYYFPAKDEYIREITELILTNNKSCYFNARKVRQNPNRLGDAVIGIVTKCISKKKYFH